MKKFVAWLLVLCLIVGVMPTVAWAEEATSGSCGENAFWSFDEKTRNLVISGTGNMKNYNDLDELAPWFDLRDQINSVEIMPGITSIGDHAFYKCEMTRIDIPEGVTSIGEFALSKCRNLPKIQIPDSVTTIGVGAFYACNKLASIVIPDGVTIIDWATFQYCSNLISVAIPGSVTDIGPTAFNYCLSLTNIVIPDAVTSIGTDSFAGCERLTSITIPSKVSYIGNAAFAWCESLSKIWFEGDAPVFDCSGGADGGAPFAGVVATAYYPDNNSTWTAEVRQDYNGTLTWVPYTPESEPIEPAPSENPFTDVSSDRFYYDPVLWAIENGITNGMTASSFAPDKECTRGQIVTFLWRAAGEPEPTATNNPFTDVKEGSFYYKAVLWAVENGITTGINKTTFAPNKACTRGQVVTFMHRAAGSSQPESTNNPFADVEKGAFYYDAVLWAVENEITSGMNATTFAPGKICTRGQIVTFLYRGYGE